MRPRSHSARRLGPLGVALLLGLTGCWGEGTPSAPSGAPPKPPAVAKPAPPPALPAAPVTEYVYEAKGRRDPFRPLIMPRVASPAKARPKTGLSSLEVHELKLAGIVWERRGFYALVEAPNGAGYVLRVNDIIGDEARVAKITAEAVTVEVKRAASPLPSAAAVTRLVELRLRKEE